MEHVPTLNLVGVCTLCTECWTRRRSHSISIRSVISIPCSTKLILHITSIAASTLYLSDLPVDFGSVPTFLRWKTSPATPGTLHCHSFCLRWPQSTEIVEFVIFQIMFRSMRRSIDLCFPWNDTLNHHLVIRRRSECLHRVGGLKMCDGDGISISNDQFRGSTGGWTHCPISRGS